MLSWRHAATVWDDLPGGTSISLSPCVARGSNWGDRWSNHCFHAEAIKLRHLAPGFWQTRSAAGVCIRSYPSLAVCTCWPYWPEEALLSTYARFFTDNLLHNHCSKHNHAHKLPSTPTDTFFWLQTSPTVSKCLELDFFFRLLLVKCNIPRRHPTHEQHQGFQAPGLQAAVLPRHSATSASQSSRRNSFTVGDI